MILQWIITFLSSRKHRVSVVGKLSNWAYANGGVPQGSVLGPILFVIVISDIRNLVRSSCKHFADDAKILHRYYDKCRHVITSRGFK